MAEITYTISLRVKHPTLRHEEIAQSLALIPKVGHTVGEQRKTPKGGLLEGIYKETYCSFELLRKQEGYFMDGIRQLIPQLSAHEQYFQTIVAQGGKAEFYVGVFTEKSTGFELSVQDMATLAKLGLQLSVEVYY